jgi:hypothetical protein
VTQKATGIGNSSISKQILFHDTDDRRQLCDVITCKSGGEHSDGVLVQTADSPIFIFGISFYAMRYVIEIMMCDLTEHRCADDIPIFQLTPTPLSRSQWQRCRRHGSAAARLLGLRV